MDSVLLGIEIGGTKLQVHTGRGDGTVLARNRFEVNTQAGARGIQKQLQSCLPEIITSTTPIAVGVGFGGPVDRTRGLISRSHQIEGWSEFPLREWLANLTNLPTTLDNDANMAALAEATLGAGRAFSPVFYVTLGSGVGGGCVVQGHIFHGAPPTESEIGHLRLDRSGTLVEQRCSGWAIDTRIRQAVSGQTQSPLAIMVRESPGHEARHLAKALAESDADAIRILQELTDDLAFALSHVTHLFHPQVIVLGGGLSNVGEALRAAVAERLPAYLMSVMSQGPVVRLSSLGEDAVPVGCLLAAAAQLGSDAGASVGA